MRSLLLSSVAFLFAFTGCTSAYKNLAVVPAGSTPDFSKQSCIEKFRPSFVSALYNTQVNVVGKHLSGLLLFKAMPDSSMRVVFSSEMGVKFFDFEFAADGSFKVHQVIKQLNKKAVIKTLQSDFALMLMTHPDFDNPVIKSDGLNTWYGFNRGKETHYYVTDSTCDALVRIENAMKRKPKVRIVMQNYHEGIPDTIGITHKNFNFDIGLKYIKR